MKNNFTSDCANCADFQYQINNFIIYYTDYDDFSDCMQKSFITNYADYTDIQ